MCACASLIGEWATGVWMSLGSPVNVSALAISGYATQPSTLGRLNSLIGQCYSGSGYAGPGTWDYDVVPDLTINELALLDFMYQQGYYNSLAQATMGYGGDSIPWAMVGEGDTKVARANPAAIGTVYAAQAKDAMAQLKYWTNVYLQNGAGACLGRQVLLPNIAYPTWSDASWGMG